jgi:hypothetical protein
MKCEKVCFNIGGEFSMATEVLIQCNGISNSSFSLGYFLLILLMKIELGLLKLRMSLT